MSATDAPSLVFARGIAAVGLGLLAGLQVTTVSLSQAFALLWKRRARL